MSSTIVILTGNHLCHNPRVVKEAAALARAGYAVTVLGAWTDSILKARDQMLVAQLPFSFVPVVDLVGFAPRVGAQRLFRRVLTKMAGLAHLWCGIESRYQLGAITDRLAGMANALSGDLFVAHSEPALYVARTLAASGQRVAVDMEDWFSEDLLPKARQNRPLSLLRNLEDTVLKRAAYATCPSRAMSAALASAFDCQPPSVVYNAFPLTDRESVDGKQTDRGERKVPSVHWCSQTLGEGRGLEVLLAALPLVKFDAEIHLRGQPSEGFERWFAARVPQDWSRRVVLHDLVSSSELLSRIAEHDIGFAGEMTYCRNKDLTVSNKVLHYLLGGLAVVASDTAGQCEVADQAPGAVHLYPAGDPAALASRLNDLLDSPSLLASSKSAALKAAAGTFCWEKQEPRLLTVVERALASARR